MRVRVNKKTDIVKIGKDPIVSAKLLSNDEISFDIEFGIDLTSCLKNEIQVASLDIFGHEIPSATSSPALEDFSDGLRSAILADAAEKALLTRIRSEYKVISIPIDVTKLISNDNIKQSKNDASVTFNVIKTYDSNFKTINNTDFVLEQPEENTFLSVEEENRRLLALGKDPSLLKGEFPIINPAISIKRRIPANRKNQFASYKKVGNPTKYTSGYVDSRYSSCITKVILSRSTISELPFLYVEINLLNKNGVTVSRDKINISTQFLEFDIKTIENRNKKEEIIRYGRVLNSRLDASQSPYVSLESGFLKQRDRTISNESKIVRTLNGKYHVSSFVSRSRASTQNTPKGSGCNIIPFSIIKIENYLQIKVENTNLGIIALGVERRDATLFESFSKLTGDGLEPVLVNDNSTITFVDSNLKHDHVYEYRLFFIDDKSNTRSSSNILTYHYSSTNVTQPASLEVTNLKREIVDEETGAYARISFDINSKLTEAGIEITKQFLSANGLSENILGIPELETTGYKKLLMYQIDRQNLRTGEVETFGTVYDSKFTDDSASPSNLKTIKPLNLLDGYKYFIRLGLRDPAALVSIQTSTKTSANGKQSYDYRSYKFRINPKSGNLPSTFKLSSNSSLSLAENFLEFSLGIETVVSSLAEDYFPVISSLTVRKTLVGFNRLNWTITGDSASIDHFRIYATADGIEALIGASHPHVIDGSYFYEDFEMFNRIGEVIYRVVPVGLNFVELRGDATVELITQNNAPTFLR